MISLNSYDINGIDRLPLVATNLKIRNNSYHSSATATPIPIPTAITADIPANARLSSTS